MALITCPECGGKVSDKAKACIHCGYPLEVLGIENTNVFKIILTGLPDKGNSKWRSSSEHIGAVTALRRRLPSLRELKYDEISEIIDECPSLLFDGLSEKNADILIQQFTKDGVTVEKQISASLLDERLNVIIHNRACAEVVCPVCGCAKITMLANYRTSGAAEIKQSINTCQKCGHGWSPRV